MAAVATSKIRYKRANNQMIEHIPAPFTLRMATSFWRRSVSSVMLEYTPNRVMIILTIAKNEMMSFRIYSSACTSYNHPEMYVLGREYSPAALHDG